MSKIFELTCAEYAAYWASLEQEGPGRPRTGNASSIRERIRNNKDLPGVISSRLIGKTYLLRVTLLVHLRAKKIIKESGN